MKGAQKLKPPKACEDSSRASLLEVAADFAMGPCVFSEGFVCSNSSHRSYCIEYMPVDIVSKPFDMDP